MEVVEEHAGAQNHRLVVRLDDGACVEAVVYRGDSLCVSTQVGCAVGCPFCASGAEGLTRPLRVAEMVGQIDLARSRGFALRRVTLSGVGEPLHNHEACLSFAARCRARGLRVSLTTSGGTPDRLSRWLVEPHHGLTISVHAGTEPVRRRLVPRGPALAPLFSLLTAELPRISRNRRRKTALAYLLIEGGNDADDEIDAFLERAAPLGLLVNLYAHNPVPTSALRGTTRARYEEVYARMTAHPSRPRVRMSSKARLEANGGCGTLVALRARPQGEKNSTPRASMARR